MKLELLHTGPLGTNTYIAYGEKDDECFVVDPANARKVQDKLKELGLRCTAVLVTHCHFDHILGVGIMQAAGATVYMSEVDAPGLYDDSVSHRKTWDETQHCHADVLLHDGDTIAAAGFTLKVITTPGHTKGGVCFVDEKNRVMYSGDTLFRYNIGRCDLAGGDPREMYESIKYKLFPLEGDFDVYPGHDAPTTLEWERQHNPYIKVGWEQW